MKAYVTAFPEIKGMLPRLTMPDGTTYTIDRRLNQLREVDNPHNYINFDSGFDLEDHIEWVLTCIE